MAPAEPVGLTAKPLPGRCLILGSVSHLPASAFVPCLRSLRNVGFDGHLCLFSKSLPPGQLERLRPFADEIIELDSVYEEALGGPLRRPLRAIRRTRGVPRASAGLARRFPRRFGQLSLAMGGLQSLRYAHYRDYLSERGHAFDLVMLSDIRDVLFQRQPFDQPVSALEVYLEEPHVTIGRPGSRNRYWYADLYGEAAVAAAGGEVVSCSGVTVGPVSQVLGYVTAMADEIDRHLPAVLDGHDQAVHNHLLQTGRLAAARRVANGTGRVLTMGMLPHVRYSREVGVLNADGSVPSVLHQYDRHAADAVRLVAALAHS